MLRHKSYKFRLYPNSEQQLLIIKTIGSVRFVFNHMLEAWDTTYKEAGKGLSYSKCSAMLPPMKKSEDTSWLKEVDSRALQNATKDLANAFDRFFKKHSQFPKFKSKKNPVQSYRTNNGNNGTSIEFVELGTKLKLKLPKLGLVKIAKSKEIKGRILNATITLKPSGKYYVSLLCEEEISELPKTNSAVGIDLGITDFAILSNGQKVDNKRFTKKMEQKLKREQRKLSRRALLAKQRGINLHEAKNYQKQKKKVARLYEKAVNQREDFLNKLSTDIIKNHDVICIEDLNVKGMLKNRKLSKAISDVSWSSFVSKLEYKANWYGKEVVKIDRWFPSSQICSDCGHKDGKKPLNIREWTCNNCGKTHDRDINASINILNQGLLIRELK